MQNLLKAAYGQPLSIFACPMGLLGLGLVWRQMGNIAPLWSTLAPIPLALGEIVFLLFFCLLVLRLAIDPKGLWAELTDQATQNYVATFSIALLLISEALRPNFEPAARVIFLFGFWIGMAIAAKSVIGWILATVDRGQMGPSWFLPVVGNLVAPPIAAKLGYVFIGWLVLCFGLISWVVLLPLISWHLWKNNSIDLGRRPTLFIYVAPPALITSAYIAMTSDANMIFPKITFTIGVLFLVGLFVRGQYFFEVPYRLTWWSYTFPVHALTLSAFSLEQVAYMPGLNVMAMGLGGMTSVITLTVVFHASRTMTINWKDEVGEDVDRSEPPMTPGGWGG